MSYRKFYLVNSNGATWEFTNEQVKSFLANPQGLGFANNLTVTRYGEVARVDGEEYTLPNPTGEIIFYDDENADRYTRYNAFARFVSHVPLTLYYQLPINPSVTYTLPCYVLSLSKSESTREKTLTCSISFQGLGFWEGQEVTVTGTGDTYTINNAGDFPIGFEITIEGSLVNPMIETVKDGTLYGEAHIVDDDSTAFDSVFINSNDANQNIVLMRGVSTLANPIGYQDLSISNGSIYVTFIKLARGSTTLSITLDSGSIDGVTIKYTPKYRSV